MKGKVVSLSRCEEHRFSKDVCQALTLLEGLGVEGDAHCGKTVKHRSRVAIDPSQPNFRQVHLIPSELLEELNEKGFSIEPGDLGENILTKGIRAMSLPVGTLLYLGDTAVVKVTGLRNPCAQIDDFQNGLLAAVLYKDKEGRLIQNAGIMGIVLSGGVISVGDEIRIELPPEPHLPLERI